MTRIALAATLAAVSAVLLAQPSDRERAEALARRATERLQSLQQEAERLASQERTLLGDLRSLEVTREIKAEEARQAAAKAADAAHALAELDDRVTRLEAENVSQQPELRARLVDLYKLGQGRYLRLLLSTSDLRSVGQAARLVAAVAERDRARVRAHEQTLRDLKTSRASLEANSRALASARAAAERARAEADRAVAARNDRIASIDRERDLNAQLAGELETARDKLQSTLRGLGSGAPAADAGLPFRPFRGDLDWPVAGRVRQRFGAAPPGRPSASGIDIAADDAAPVRAVHQGTVAFAGPFAGFGNLVILQHETDVFTLYGNLSDIAVQRGARVDAGQTLGSVGSSATGPTGLYFEVRVGGQAVDPLQWLKKVP
jgi:septal ring factor EnvC (AmiA/AmiB activator)